jgi:hypothetical protein
MALLPRTLCVSSSRRAMATMTGVFVSILLHVCCASVIAVDQAAMRRVLQPRVAQDDREAA